MHVSKSPTETGGCEGASTLPLEDGAGVRACHESVVQVTEIPADTEGVLIATIEVFLPNGTIIGLSGQSPTNLDETISIDREALDVNCEGPLR
jgi:hypothetical protein